MAKSLEELTITDDFMFGAVMRDPRRCKPLLELILDVKIHHIEYPELQKFISERYDSKSIRLDVYVEDDAGTVYDIEIQTTSKKHLPRRVRYYQGLIDLSILEKGEDYRALRKSCVIFIATYDPFGKGRFVYTFENRCKENLDLPLGDDAVKIVLNTKGFVGEISQGLNALLKYMDGMQPKSDYTRELEKAVEEVISDEKWRREFMVMIERDRANRRLGEFKRSIAQVRRFRDRFGKEDLAEICFVTPQLLGVIIDSIDAHPDWDDEEIAESIDFD